MKMVEEYTTIQDTEVNDYIKKGWQPFGPPFHTQDTEVIQAMVKYSRSELTTWGGLIESPHKTLVGDNDFIVPNNPPVFTTDPEKDVTTMHLEMGAQTIKFDWDQSAQKWVQR